MSEEEKKDAPQQQVEPTDSDAEKEAKVKAAAEARAARAAARAAKKTEEEGGDEADKPKEPSPNQPRLDRLVALIQQHAGPEAVEEAVINERDRHLPTVTVAVSHWFAVAQLLQSHDELNLHYLRNMTGIDYETHMAVMYHLVSLEAKHDVCIQVKTSREQPSIPSVTPVWSTANWNEREIYDLLGIDFPGHPDMRRIMMPDDWVGHPLRKDYEPFDPEV